MDTILFILLLVIVFLLFKEKNSKKENTKNETLESIYNKDIYPYKVVSSLMTKYEQNFFLVLSMALNDKPYYIFPKVRLADIVQVDSRENYQSYFNKIKSKHIDYLICDKNSFKPLYAIELDDSTHELEHRIIRDDFLNNCCSNAGIKLIRFKPHNSYKVTEIKEKLGLFAPSEY